MANRATGYAAGGGAQTYTTIAAAFAAASALDNIQLYYSDASKGRFWHEVVSAAITTKVVGVQGMLDTRQVCIVQPTGAHFLQASGDLSGISSQVTYQNLTVMATSVTANFNFGYWNDTTGGGQGIRVTSCTMLGGYSMFHVAAGDSNVCQVDNCCGIAQIQSMRCLVPCLLYFVTSIAANTYGFIGNNQAHTITDVACLNASTADFIAYTNATVTYCCDSDGSLPVAAGNITKTDPDDLDFWCDNNNSHYGMNDFRILTSSDLYGAGIAIPGITTDCDGNTRADPPSIGWHEGTPTAYPGTAPTFAGITSLTNNADRTLTAEWAAATGSVRYLISLHTSAMIQADLDNNTYLVGAVDDGVLEARLCSLKDGTLLTAGTLYYVAVRAISSGGTQDANVVNESVIVTDPRAVGGPIITNIDVDPDYIGTSYAVDYTVPATKEATAFVGLANTDTVGRTVSLLHVPSGQAADAKYSIAPNGHPLGAAGSATAVDKFGPIVMQPGDTIQSLADAASKVVRRVDGIEETLQ